MTKKDKKKIIYFIGLILVALFANDYITSLKSSKEKLEDYVYTDNEMRKTIYCEVIFDETKNTYLPDDFPKSKRAMRIEWEHVVPSSKLNNEDAKADMYNLYPAVGSVNGKRSNYDFAELPDAVPDFETCGIKIDKKKVEPPDYAKGNVARTYLYMDDRYPEFTLTSKQKALMQKWSEIDKVDDIECKRTKRIERMQKNENKIVKDLCVAQKLW